MDANPESELPEVATEDVAPAAAVDTEVSNGDASDVNDEPFLDDLIDQAKESPKPAKQKDINDAELLGIHGHIKNTVDEEELGEYFYSLPQSKQNALAKRFPRAYGDLVQQEVQTPDYGDIEERLERKLEVKQQLRSHADKLGLDAKQREQVTKLYNQYVRQGNTPEIARKLVLGDLHEKGYTSKEQIEKAKVAAKRSVGQQLPSSSQQVSVMPKLTPAEFDKLPYEGKKDYRAKMKQRGEKDMFK